MRGPDKVKSEMMTSGLLLLLGTLQCSGLAIVLPVPHDIYPGYSITKFGLGAGPGHAYHLLPNEFSDYFTVLKNGLLMSTANISSLVDHPVSLLVREDVPESNLSTTHTVQLHVLDSQSMLRFPEETYEGTVAENRPLGTHVQGFPLIRPTADPGRRLKYEILSGDGEGLFHAGLNETTNGLQILTTQELDRETKKEYTLVIKASDLGGVDTALTRLVVQVQDENDNGPVFQKPLYRWAVSVNTSRFTVVGTVKAVDADGDHVSYRLSAPSSTFVVVPQTGEVLLVNRPEASSYELEVYAHDVRSPSLTSDHPATVIVSVGDEEAKDSVMGIRNGLESPYQRIGPRPTLRKKFTESEGQLDGRVVFELNKEVELESFKLRNENPWVTVDPNGAVRVKKKWDYEELGQEKTIDFWVMITNPEANSSGDNQRVIIYVKDANDEAPYFINRPLPMQAVVQLNAPPNTPVFTLQARDPDTDHSIRYFIVRDRTGGRFEVDERSGVVRTRATDPFQLHREYVLYVLAEDQNGRLDDRRFQSTPEERLSIVGGKRPPQFCMPKYEAEIPEDWKMDSDIITVKAKSFSDSEIRYTLKASGKQGGGTFNITPTTGIVKLAKELDLEDLRQPHVFQLMLIATEDSEGFSTSVELTIRVTDVNDNVPKFELPDYEAHYIEEDLPVETSILKVKATDSDSGSNAEIEYVVSDDHFRIDSNGVIRNNKQLEADNNNAYYEFVVTARDKGDPPQTGSATVRIYTKNKNDDEPKFSQQVYTLNVDENEGADTLVTTVVVSSNPPVWGQVVYGPIHVKENMPVGATVVSVKASSGIEENPTVFYQLIRGSTAQTQKYETFYLQERHESDLTWADIKINYPLDLETNKEYNLTVRVENNGAQQLAAEASIYIILEDVNDEIPLFTEGEQETVAEGEAVGTRVSQVIAIDKDGTAPNNLVKYYVANSVGKDFFEVNEFTGEIFTKIVFDREKQGAYALSIEARDSAPSARPNSTGQSNSATKFIRIEIGDKNDNPPYFEKVLYEVEVDENEDLQHTVLTVTAKDLDESSPMHYEITRGNKEGAFGVNNTTGAIYVAGPLDYETRNRYELRLSASDNKNENFTTVVINVKDQNDNVPVFDRPNYETQISEEDDRNLPKRVLQVTVSDGDKDRPQNILYFLSGQGIDHDNPTNSKFDINRTTGEIYVLKPLDRDPPNGRAQWWFTVFAQDEGGEGLVGYADVELNLRDINDNPPIFPQGVYLGNVTENGTSGLVVMIMTALDYDDPNEGTNSKLTYSIEKNVMEEDEGRPIFEIEPETGVIKTAVCCLDREKTPDYAIQVVATDGGGLKGTGTASIRVTDINGMPPRFTKEEWFTEVDETDGDTLPDTPILTVTVHDEDETKEFHYKVLENSGFGADKFRMVRNNDGTGSLKIVRPLDYEDPLQSQGFRFRIQVSDKGDDNDQDRYHVAYAWVKVALRDINDQPQFEKPNVEVSVYENAEVGKRLETFKATDPDEAGQSKVTYAIDRSSDRNRQFSVSQDGTVRIQRALDREETSRHQIKILAIDDGLPPKTATATLSIIVQDINDNAPTFLEDYRAVLPENRPPRKIVEILATDADDRSRGNGPPFTFRMDPKASHEIKGSFKVEYEPKGANGDGIAIVSSLRMFDREQRKEFLVPINIRDSGSPALTGTSTLTVIIGDINDNLMMPSTKEILVYDYGGQGGQPETDIGRVYVFDLDDWDLQDKRFYWKDQEQPHPRFFLNQDSGMITMKEDTLPGIYELEFVVFERYHTQVEVPANVTVVVREISHEAVLHAGSIRIAGISDEDFIRVWDYRTHSVIRSKAELLQTKLAQILGTDEDKVDVFSVQLQQQRPPVTDIRFSAPGSPYYSSVRLNGLVLLHREQIEREVGINITMIGIDECLYEKKACEGSCTNKVEISSLPYTVDANKTALVGVRIQTFPECTCGARNFSEVENDSCRKYECYNGGQCIEARSGPLCVCPRNYDGPRCQITSRTFRQNDWAWYPALETCEKSHMSLEFITEKGEGLLLYNGPLVSPEPEEIILSDFISLELEKGEPRLLIDFGSGTLELRIQSNGTLSNGEWHRIDIFWDTESVRMVLDLCKSGRVSEADDGSPTVFDSSYCLVEGQIPPFNEYLNVNTPLQLGGIRVKSFDPSMFRWTHVPTRKHFDGCIRNLIHNSKLYDLGNPGLSRHKPLPASGCQPIEDLCLGNNMTSGCSEHGYCAGSFNEPKCECKSGWMGPSCSAPTVATTFKAQSYVKYALSFEPDRFLTLIQLRFRTREAHGELFRISGQQNREYGILEIKDSRLRFRFNLNSLRTEERSLCLSFVPVDDGEWHTAKVARHGSIAMLELDGGEGKRYNETFGFEGHQWMQVDKQEGVYAGGKAEYTGHRSFEVYADYKKSCLDDIRLEGKHLPLPPSLNGTQWGQATMSRNLVPGCPSNKPCDNVRCPEPFNCTDLWNDYECA